MLSSHAALLQNIARNKESGVEVHRESQISQQEEKGIKRFFGMIPRDGNTKSTALILNNYARVNAFPQQRECYIDIKKYSLYQ